MEELNEKAITDRIRHYRTMRKMTLDHLASLSGLTKGYLSRIENSGKAPPISTLGKIASSLDVDIVSLLKEDEASEKDNLAIVRKIDRKVIGDRSASCGYTYESLAYRIAGKNMDPYLITITEEPTATIFEHEGEEFIHILSGKMKFFYEGETYILEEGDSAYFNSGVAHSGMSVGGAPARFLCVIYSYRRA